MPATSAYSALTPPPPTVAPGRLIIGTSGWSLPVQRHPAPVHLPAREQLRRYSAAFPAVEITTTAYRAPEPLAIKRWRRQLPAGFTFCFKLWHGITHRQGLGATRAALAAFIGGVRPLLGAGSVLLVQLPASFEPDPGRLMAFLDLLDAALEGLKVRTAVEFHHGGWFRDDIEQLMSARRTAWCVADLPGSVNVWPNQAGFVYIRRHGPYGDSGGSYSDERLMSDACNIAAWQSRGLDVYVFFCNSLRDGAMLDAARLGGMLGVVARGKAVREALKGVA